MAASWTSAAGAAYDKEKNNCVSTPAAANTCTVNKTGAIYDAPGGKGQQIGELAAKTQGVVLLKKDGSDWYNVRWPNGEGWAYSGPGFEDALNCP
jgi:hypothetical protein